MEVRQYPARDSIDSLDFKNYIFDLLFLKRFNDVLEVRVAQLMLAEGLGASEAEQLSFNIKRLKVGRASSAGTYRSGHSAVSVAASFPDP